MGGMAKAMGVDYEMKIQVVCDPASPKFIEAYFKYLHHPREGRRVDFLVDRLAAGKQL